MHLLVEYSALGSWNIPGKLPPSANFLTPLQQRNSSLKSFQKLRKEIPVFASPSNFVTEYLLGYFSWYRALRSWGHIFLFKIRTNSTKLESLETTPCMIGLQRFSALYNSRRFFSGFCGCTQLRFAHKDLQENNAVITPRPQNDADSINITFPFVQEWIVVVAYLVPPVVLYQNIHRLPTNMNRRWRFVCTVYCISHGSYHRCFGKVQREIVSFI